MEDFTDLTRSLRGRNKFIGVVNLAAVKHLEPCHSFCEVFFERDGQESRCRTAAWCAQQTYGFGRRWRHIAERATILVNCSGISADMVLGQHFSFLVCSSEMSQQKRDSLISKKINVPHQNTSFVVGSTACCI